MKKKTNLTPTNNTSEKSGISTLESPITTPEAKVAEIKQELAEKGLEAISKIEVTDPFTGKKQLITIDRTGHHEQKLIIALANPDLNRDQKDHVLSMYLYERGKESASFIVDLMRYKGEHTKENRVFQSRMRFDFETFVSMFIGHLQRQAEVIGKILGVDIPNEKMKFAQWLTQDKNKGNGYTYWDYCQNGLTDEATRTLEHAIFIQTAINDLDEAERLLNSINRIKQARESQKGGGIYVDKSGTPFSINDPDLEEIIKKDREIQKEAENENA